MIKNTSSGAVTLTAAEANLLSRALQLAKLTCITLEADKNEEEGYVEVRLWNILGELEDKGIGSLDLDPTAAV